MKDSVKAIIAIAVVTISLGSIYAYANYTDSKRQAVILANIKENGCEEEFVSRYMSASDLTKRLYKSELNRREEKRREADSLRSEAIKEYNRGRSAVKEITPMKQLTCQITTAYKRYGD